jgi:hypothetical protein
MKAKAAGRGERKVMIALNLGKKQQPHPALDHFTNACRLFFLFRRFIRFPADQAGFAIPSGVVAHENDGAIMTGASLTSEGGENLHPYQRLRSSDLRLSPARIEQSGSDWPRMASPANTSLFGQKAQSSFS